jgi:hypothetical protein
MTLRAASASWRSDVFQPVLSALTGIWLMTVSAMPSSRSVLLRTWV